MRDQPRPPVAHHDRSAEQRAQRMRPGVPEHPAPTEIVRQDGPGDPRRHGGQLPAAPARSASTTPAALPGRTFTRLTKCAAPAITTPASTLSSGRSFSSAPATSPAAEIPANLTAPPVTSPSRSAPRCARNPRRGSPADDIVVRPADPGDEHGTTDGRPHPSPPSAAPATAAGPGYNATVRPAKFVRSQRSRPPGAAPRSTAAPRA